MKTLKSLCAVVVLSTSLFAVENAAESGVRKRVADFQDAWNKHDAKAIAAFWAEDGDMISPMGMTGTGRAEVEKLVAGDLANFIRDGISTFAVTHIRFVKSDVIVLDMTHETADGHAPDGSVIPTNKVLVTAVGMKKNGTWWWLAARPMIPFMMPPMPPQAPPAPPAPAK
jgi:uncharacterized protein (TIGR02246 family)